VLRAVLLVSVMSMLAIPASLVLRPVLLAWGIDGTANFLLTLCIGDLALAPFFTIWTCAGTTDYSSARLNIPWVISTMFTAPPAVGIVLVLRSQHGIPLFAYAIAGACTAVVWGLAFRQAHRHRHAHLRRPIRLDDVRVADDLISDCRRQLQDPSLSADERAAVELNLVGALVAASLGDRENHLPEAYEILQRSLNSRPPAWTFVSAMHFVDAMGVKAQRSGDLDGYEGALQLLLDAATNASAELPDAPGMALSARASSLVQLMGLAASEGDSERVQHLYSEAVADLERALEMSRRGSSLHAQHTIALARILGLHTIDADLDGAVKSCRRALRRLRVLGDYRQRAEGYLTLADLLALRAQVEPSGPVGDFLQSLWPGRPKDGFIGFLWPERRPYDLLRAARLCMGLSWRGGELAPLARTLFSELMYLVRAEVPDFVPLPTRQIGWMNRHVFAEQSRISPGGAVAHAEKWSRWAADAHNVRQAAEAHWYWLTAAVAESRRRVFQAEKERQLSQVQGLAADASAWLLAARRARDAAVALELGRAVLLTERMQRDRAGLEQRLVVAGREDLSDRWREVSERVSETDRAAYDARLTPPAPATIDVRGHAFAATFTSAEYAAHADHEQLVREISRVRGCEDVDASPTYDDLRAAAREGPVVYVAATDRGGSAVIVTEAPDPIVVELPTLHMADIDQHARQLLRAQDLHEIAEEIAVQLPWLWEVLMQPLVAHLPPMSIVTLIPVGALSQLAIHAASAAPNPDGIWCDQMDELVFRYAPNARVLLKAQAAAHGLSSEGLKILTVQVPDPPGDRPLPRAAMESLGVAAQFPQRQTARPSPATVANVIAALDGCAVWHFACHGRHDPDEPLASYLLLEDGPLTLRTIFARPAGRRRLAVLSACQTAMPDSTLLDEVVNFPSALLQAGVGGVVSSQTLVNDEAAMLLILRFFERFREGIVPARALAEAQAWLRCATNGQIHDAFPEAYPVPARNTGRALTYWREQQMFTEPHNWAVFSYSGL